MSKQQLQQNKEQINSQKKPLVFSLSNATISSDPYPNSSLRTSQTHPLTISWILPHPSESQNSDISPITKATSIKPHTPNHESSLGVISNDAIQLEPPSLIGNSSSGSLGQKRKSRYDSPPTLLQSNNSKVSSIHHHPYHVGIDHSSSTQHRNHNIRNNRNTSEPSSDPSISPIPTTQEQQQGKVASKLGNLALSSAPGKKVRLNQHIQVSRKAPVARDLDSDFTRIKSFGIGAIVNLLDNQELSFLGIPWSSYTGKATEFGLEVVRYPIEEGRAPLDLEEFHESVMQPLDQLRQKGVDALIHCRGGMGRAGLVACCWLLRYEYVRDAEEAISLVRRRRSIRAIETEEQENFIAEYAEYVESLSK